MILVEHLPVQLGGGGEEALQRGRLALDRTPAIEARGEMRAPGLAGRGEYLQRIGVAVGRGDHREREDMQVEVARIGVRRVEQAAEAGEAPGHAGVGHLCSP